MNLNNFDLSGKDAEAAMDKAGIIINKNTVPFETRGPFITSGLRAGTPSATTRGMKEKQMEEIANFIDTVIRNVNDEKVLKEVNADVQQLCADFPIYANS
jgi:glycine hydroxymethyltransferase